MSRQKTFGELSIWTKRRRVRADVALEEAQNDPSSDSASPHTSRDYPNAENAEGRQAIGVTTCILPTCEFGPHDTDISHYSDFDYGIVSASDDTENSDTDSDISSEHRGSYASRSNVSDLERELANWAIQNNISQNSLSSLLKILHNYMPGLPIDARTLLRKSKPIESVIKPIDGGEFAYLGVAPGIFARRNDLNLGDNSDVITLQINIDGLPIFKSSNVQVWPILGIINQCSDKTPFVIGVFSGQSKPKNINEFLGDFVAEINSAEKEGIAIGDKKYKIEISCFICDAPARAFIKNTKSHTGYSSCERCMQRGQHVGGRMTFPLSDCPPRNNIQFNELLDDDHHHGPTPLSKLNVGLVSNVVLDYMHLVCLGVVRRLIYFWSKGPFNCRQKGSTLADISSHLIDLQRVMPAEFARKPRGMHEVDRWKATEFRQFLLYYGSLVLKGKLPTKLWQHFLCLTTAITILVSPSLSHLHCDYAEELLTFFVQTFAQIYGAEYLVYNVHNLIHLADDVRRFGPLDNISAFPFENYLGHLKKHIRKPQHVVKQIINRISEKDFCRPSGALHFNLGAHRQHCSGPVNVDMQGMTQYKELQLQKFCIKLNDKDNCVIIDENVCLVRNILSDSSSEYLMYEKFESKEAFFSYPISSDSIGTFKVSRLSKKTEMCPVSAVQHKCVIMPYKSVWVAIVLLHTS